MSHAIQILFLPPLYSYNRQQHYSAALGVLDSELTRDGRNPDTWLTAAVIQMRAGDIASAEASVSSAAYLVESAASAFARGDPFSDLDPLRSPGGTPYAQTEHQRQAAAVRLVSGLLDAGRQDWEAAAAAFQPLAALGGPHAAAAAGNAAICKLYLNDLHGAIDLLESAFREQPTQMLQVGD